MYSPPSKTGRPRSVVLGVVPSSVDHSLEIALHPPQDLPSVTAWQGTGCALQARQIVGLRLCGARGRRCHPLLTGMPNRIVERHPSWRALLTAVASSWGVPLARVEVSAITCSLRVSCAGIAADTCGRDRVNTADHRGQLEHSSQGGLVDLNMAAPDGNNKRQKCMGRIGVGAHKLVDGLKRHLGAAQCWHFNGGR